MQQKEPKVETMLPPSSMVDPLPIRAPKTDRVVSALMLCGVLSGPVYVGLAIAQMLFREGFDIRRHPVSLLCNGDWGWVQIANFLASGALVMAFALGLPRAFPGRRGSFLGPLLIGLYGLGVFGAGIFLADPALGFPPGAPPGSPAKITWQGGMHFLCAGIGFLTLIVGCLIFAARFALRRDWGWAVFSAATGILFFAGFFAIASGSRQVWINIAFSLSVVLVWLWISLLGLRFWRTLTETAHPTS